MLNENNGYNDVGSGDEEKDKEKRRRRTRRPTTKR